MRIPKKISALLEDRHEQTLERLRYFQNVLTHLHYEGKASLGKNVRETREVLGFFKKDVGRHMEEEEKVLFPFLEAHIPRLGPFLSILRAEHNDFRGRLRHFDFCLNKLAASDGGLHRGALLQKLKETGTYLVYLLQNHLREETEVLYKIADRELGREEKNKLMNQINRKEE